LSLGHLRRLDAEQAALLPRDPGSQQFLTQSVTSLVVTRLARNGSLLALVNQEAKNIIARILHGLAP
jgi:hypothetical protein